MTTTFVILGTTIALFWGYQFNDFAKVGLPLMLLFLAVSLVLVPVIWPL